MKPRHKHADTGHVPTRSTYEPVADSAFMQPPQRVRYGADAWITQEVIDIAMAEWRRNGRQIRKVRMETIAVKRRAVSKKGPPKSPVGFHEIDIEADQKFARSGI